MKTVHAQAIAKVIAFSTVATISSVVLTSNGSSVAVVIPSGIGIASVTLLVSEQQGGIE